MAKTDVTLTLTIDRRALVLAAAAVIVLCTLPQLGSESVTLTTYYPAPSGVYTKMITTADTFISRDRGVVGIGTAQPLGVGAKMAVMGGSVGIGTTSPVTSQNGRRVNLHATGNIDTDDVYLSNPKSGTARWASEVGQPTVSQEYGCAKPNGVASARCAISNHDVCFMVGVKTYSDDSNIFDGCRIEADSSGNWTIHIAMHATEPYYCYARCLDWGIAAPPPASTLPFPPY